VISCQESQYAVQTKRHTHLPARPGHGSWRRKAGVWEGFVSQARGNRLGYLPFLVDLSLFRGSHERIHSPFSFRCVSNVTTPGAQRLPHGTKTTGHSNPLEACTVHIVTRCSLESAAATESRTMSTYWCHSICILCFRIRGQH
jgi:hypothetical protein